MYTDTLELELGTVEPCIAGPKRPQDRIPLKEADTVYEKHLKKAIEKLETFDTPYTPANTMIRGLRVSLRKIREEGIENVWARHERLASAARAGMEALGLELSGERPASGLTVAKVPSNVDGIKLLKTLEEKYGLKLAGGQAELKGKIIRLAHMGYADQFEVLAALSGLELALSEQGYSVEIGGGVAAAQRSLASV